MSSWSCIPWNSHDPGNVWETISSVPFISPRSTHLIPHIGNKGVGYPSGSVHLENSAQPNSLLAAFAQVAPLQIATARGNKLLTQRENDVAKHVVQGFSNREVSQKLGLTEPTVSNYLFRIYEKLGISSRVELVLYYLGNSNP